MAEIVDDTPPPEASSREDCRQPFRCVCPDDEPCHHEALARNVPDRREELEMPDRDD